MSEQEAATVQPGDVLEHNQQTFTVCAVAHMHGIPYFHLTCGNYDTDAPYYRCRLIRRKDEPAPAVAPLYTTVQEGDGWHVGDVVRDSNGWEYTIGGLYRDGNGFLHVSIPNGNMSNPDASGLTLVKRAADAQQDEGEAA